MPIMVGILPLMVVTTEGTTMDTQAQYTDEESARGAAMQERARTEGMELYEIAREIERMYGYVLDFKLRARLADALNRVEGVRT